MSGETPIALIGPELRSRLENWKFSSALAYEAALTGEDRETLRALARVFGNVGWFDGDLGTIVSDVVGLLVSRIDCRGAASQG